MDEKVFSKFEVKETAIKFSGDSAAERIGCVGKMTETKNLRQITKKCEGVVKKQVTRGDGTVGLQYELHIRKNLLHKLLGMEFEELKEGIYAYGENSVHQEGCITARVKDEDGRAMLWACPRFSITEAYAEEIENGAEEVAQVNISGTGLPDEYGNAVYNAYVDELDETGKEAFITAWLTNFDSDATRKPSA